MPMAKDRIVYTNDDVTLYDENDEEIEFHLVARITLHDTDYVVLEDPEDEDNLMIFYCVKEEDGTESYTAVDSEEESEEVFYLFEACYMDYEVGNAI